MNRDEFLQACADGGYAWRETAVKYARDKDEFTIDDIIAVYRLQEVISPQSIEKINSERGMRMREGAWTTKYFTNMSSDKY